MSEELIGLIVVLFNIAFVACMFFVQSQEVLPKRTKSFLHLEDCKIHVIGDPVGFSLIDLAVVLTAFHQGASLWYILLFVVASVIVFAYYKGATKSGREPDWSLVEGRITKTGKVHLIYFGYQATVSVFGLYYLFTGQMTGLIMWTAFLGLAVYLIVMAFDVRANTFWLTRKT